MGKVNELGFLWAVIKLALVLMVMAIIYIGYSYFGEKIIETQQRVEPSYKIVKESEKSDTTYIYTFKSAQKNS